MDRDLEAPIELARRPAERPVGTRPVRKDEIDLLERGIHIESWLPERRTRRKPLLLVHGELGGSWVWHRYQEYFAQRGWEAHAVNLRGHYWSETADYETLDFATYVGDVTAAARAARWRRGPDRTRLRRAGRAEDRRAAAGQRPGAHQPGHAGRVARPGQAPSAARRA